MTTLAPEQIEYRGEIIDGVDEAVCDGCGLAVPDGAAADPAWFIDTEQVARRLDERAPAHLVVTDTLAIIRCPACW